MSEEEHRFPSNYQAAANVFLSPNKLTKYKYNILINKQISSENADFPRLLVGLGIRSCYAVSIDRIEGLVRLNLLAQSEWKKAIISRPVCLYPLGKALLKHYWYRLIRTMVSPWLPLSSWRTCYHYETRIFLIKINFTTVLAQALMN